MIRTLTVTNYLGESLTMDLFDPDISAGFIIKSITGLGPGNASINLTEVSTNDGGIFNSSRLDSRNIVITLAFTFHPTVEDVRLLSYKYFPIKKPLTLTFKTDNRIAQIEGYVEKNDPSIFSKEESTQISIICPDPFFYSAGEDGLNKTRFSDVEPAFEFPFCNDSLTQNLLEMSTLTIYQEKSVEYYGDAETGVLMTIHAMGAAGNITIYNTATRESMKIDTNKIKSLTGSGIVAGDDIEISTQKGKKYIHLIRGGNTINILNSLDKNSKWFQLSRGDNLFAYTAETGSSNIQFTIENRNVYEGI